jgi:hypothetical protein
MLVRVYFVGLMRSAASVFRGVSEPHDESSNSDTDEDDGIEDRDTWPEAGLASESRTVAEMRIELSGSATDVDARTHRLLDVLERDVREITHDWDCRVQVTPGGRER